MRDRKGNIFGNWKLGQLLGQGGTGEVYLAEHIYLKTLAAIKVLSPENKDLQKKDFRLFLEEAKRSFLFFHKNVIRTHDFGIYNNDELYIVMDYASGGTLRQRHPKDIPVPIETVIPYVKHIASALQYTHDQKTAHLDVKPENMLLDENGTVLLSDFGIARLLPNDELNYTTTDVRGTYYYMALEQRFGRPSIASDQYSLAAVVYEWLAGHALFAGKTNSEITIEQNDGKVPPLPLDVQIPNKTQIEAVLYKALSKKPDDRYASVQAFAQALEQAAQPPTLPPPPVGPLPPRPWYKRVQKRSRLVAGVSLLALIALIVALLATVHPPPPSGSTSCPAITTATAKTPLEHQMLDNQCRGLSNGDIAFDQTSVGSSDKLKAAAFVRQGDIQNAIDAYQKACMNSTIALQGVGDGESCIYLQDLYIRQLHLPYFTIVVGTMLTGSPSDIKWGQGTLEGVYMAQAQFNENAKNRVKENIIIANSGGSDANQVKVYLPEVSQWIVNAKALDASIIGVFTWGYSRQTLAALPILANAQLPMVSPSSTSNELTGVSRFFYRIVPDDTTLAVATADYAFKSMGVRNVALFLDPLDPYSTSLATAFFNEFILDGGQVTKETFTLNDPHVGDKLNAAQNHFDLVYLAAYADDAAHLLPKLPAGLPVMGGDALYEPAILSKIANFKSLIIASFAFHDYDCQSQACVNNHTFEDAFGTTFNPFGVPTTETFGRNFPDSEVILSFDAMNTLLRGYQLVQKHPGNVTAADLKMGLDSIQGNNTLMGVSGPIAFDPATHNPINKPILLLHIIVQNSQNLTQVFKTCQEKNNIITCN